MNTRVSSLARRIAAIEKEFSEREIQQAVKLLEKDSSSSQFSAYLSNGTKSTTRRAKSPRRRKANLDQRSRAVLRLERQDPEKYRVLSEFDFLLRKGRVLPKVNDVRNLGESLTKDFTSRNSRRASISKLMEILATRSLDEVTEVVDSVLSVDDQDNGKSDYQRLADFIITGKSSRSERQSGPRAS